MFIPQYECLAALSLPHSYSIYLHFTICPGTQEQVSPPSKQISRKAFLLGFLSCFHVYKSRNMKTKENNLKC